MSDLIRMGRDNRPIADPARLAGNCPARFQQFLGSDVFKFFSFNRQFCRFKVACELGGILRGAALFYWPTLPTIGGWCELTDCNGVPHLVQVGA